MPFKFNMCRYATGGWKPGAGPIVYSHHHHVYIVYWYTKHPGPIVHSHHHHVYIVYWYTKHQGPIVYSHHHHVYARLNSSVLSFFDPPVRITCLTSVEP